MRYLNIYTFLGCNEVRRFRPTNLTTCGSFGNVSGSTSIALRHKGQDESLSLFRAFKQNKCHCVNKQICNLRLTFTHKRQNECRHGKSLGWRSTKSNSLKQTQHSFSSLESCDRAQAIFITPRSSRKCRTDTVQSLPTSEMAHIISH